MAKLPANARECMKCVEVESRMFTSLQVLSVPPCGEHTGSGGSGQRRQG